MSTWIFCPFIFTLTIDASTKYMYWHTNPIFHRHGKFYWKITGIADTAKTSQDTSINVSKQQQQKNISNELNWQNPKIGAEIYKFIYLFIPYGEGRSHYICGPHKYNEHFLDEEKHVICIDAECPTSRHHLNFPIKCLYMPEMAMFFYIFFVI